MRKTVAFASVALVAAVVTIWGATVIVANSPKKAGADSASIDVMQMMRNVKNLPEERFDAY